MASTHNAFNLLVGTGEQVSQSKKKKNNKKKNAGAADAGNGQPEAPPPQAVAAPRPASAKPAASNGSHTAAPKAAAPKAQDAPKAAAPAANVVVDVAEAAAIFERAAREAKTINDKAKLWKDWVKQASDNSGKGMKYKAGGGSYIDFKQALLQSRALEISIEGCMVTGIGQQNEPVLQQLLSAFFPSVDGKTCQIIANTLSRLATLLADDAPDTVGSAQRAVHSVIGSLKSKGSATASTEANPVGSWESKIASVEQEILRQQKTLQQLAKTNSGAVSNVNLARDIVKLHQERYDLLQPENMPRPKGASAVSDAALKSLRELQAVVSSHLLDAERPEVPSKGKGGDKQKQASEAVKREEAVLLQQANELANQIRSLEAQLRSLRAQQSEVEEKRTRIAQQQRQAFEQVGSKGGNSRPQGVLTPSHYKNELELIQGLMVVVDPSEQKLVSPDQVNKVQSQRVSCPVEYVYDGQRYLDMVQKALSDLPQKLSFCVQRISQADKLVQLGAAAGADKAKKQKEDSEKLFADHMKNADDLMKGATEILAQVHSRYDALCHFAKDQADEVEQGVKAMDTIVAAIKAKHEEVQSLVMQTAKTPAPAQYAAPVVPPAPVQRAAPAPPKPAAPAPATVAPVPPAKAPAPATVAATPAPPAKVDPAPKLAEAPPSNGAAVPVPVPVPAAPLPVPANKKITPPKQWGKIEEAPVASAGDDSLPTPAEAFGSAEDGFKPVGGKKNRKKA